MVINQSPRATSGVTCGFARTYNVTYPALQCRTAWCHCPKIPSPFFMLSSSLHIPAVTKLSAVSIVSAFLERPMAGAVRHAASSDWLLTFADMPCVSPDLVALFLLITESCPIVWVYDCACHLLKGILVSSKFWR